MFSLPPGSHDRWLRFGLESRQLEDGEIPNKESPLPYFIPRVTLTSGLTKFWNPVMQKVGTSPLPQAEGLVFFAVIQGRPG